VLLLEIAELQNLSRALAHCRSGKRLSMGYQKFLLTLPAGLMTMRGDLLENRYQWHPYRKILVFDPKRREILAAPFRDRIVHQAICQKLGATINASIPDNSFACRLGMGNSHAAEHAIRILKTLGPERYALKLDVRQYFASIRHDLLLSHLKSLILDSSPYILLESLIASHREYQKLGRGIPIGNVTSQAFANLYLSPVDRLAAAEKDVHYIRYMDDMLLLGSDKKAVRALEGKILDLVHTQLDLEIPFQKRVQLGKAPIPFLGYRLDHSGYSPLARNQRRFHRRVRQLQKQGVRSSLIAQVESSYRAWEYLDTAYNEDEKSLHDVGEVG
jgi:hypothetical protein